jgi:hypothetical protein
MIGMGITYLDGQWPQGVEWGRVWDIGCHWGAIHTGPDQYDFSRLDQVVDRMHNSGMKIIYTIGGCPRWLSNNPDSTTAAPWMGPGSNGLPATKEAQDEFNKFAYQLVNRYKGRIQAYEVWNEPQLKEFLDPYDLTNCEILAAITKRFNKNAKTWDPNCLVLGASILPRASSGGMTRATKYLTSMQNAGWNVDYMTCHIYPVVGEGGVAWNNYLKEVRTKLSGMGAPKANVPWVTETMFNLLGEDPGDAATDTWVKGAYNGSKNLGVSMILWYAWNRPDLGGPLIYTGSQAWDSIQAYGGAAGTHEEQSWLDRVTNKIITTVQSIATTIVDAVKKAAQAIKTWFKRWIGN